MKRIFVAAFAVLFSICLNASNIEVLFDGQTVSPRSLMGCHFVGTTQKTPFEVEFRADSTYRSFDVSPHSKKLKADVNGSVAKFVVEKPGYYAVTVDGWNRYYLFVDESDFSDPKGVDITTLGPIDNTGKTDVTAKLQEAIEKMAKKKKTLVIPAGRYRCCHLYLPSNTKLQLNQGAELRLDANRLKTYKDERFLGKSFICGSGKNIKISGLGSINCNATRLLSIHGPAGRVRAVLFDGAEKLTIEGITILDSGSWTTHIRGCKNVNIHNIKVISNLQLEGTDGIDPDGVKNMTVQNCFVCSGDDGICVKSSKYKGFEPTDCENVMIKGNFVVSGCCALKIGTETYAETMKNISFIDNDVLLTRWGPELMIRDGQILSNILFENNRYEDWYYGHDYNILSEKENPSKGPFDVTTLDPSYIKPEAKRYGTPIYISANARKKTVVPGDITGVVLKDIFMEKDPVVPKPSRINGGKPAKVEVIIDNFVIGGKKIMTVADLNLDKKHAKIEIK